MVAIVGFALTAVAATNYYWGGYYFTFDEQAAPSNPAAGKVAFYAKTAAGEMCSLSSAGVETCMSAGGGGGGGGANVADAFVTIGHPADLTGERSLTGDATISVTDGGANNNVTLSRAALTGDITASAGSNATTLATGVKANVVEATLDFGATGGFDSPATAVAATWVTATSKVICNPSMLATADRPDGSDDALLDELQASIYARSAGVGFTVKAHAPNRAFGKFIIQCVGSG